MINMRPNMHTNMNTNYQHQAVNLPIGVYMLAGQHNHPQNQNQNHKQPQSSPSTTPEPGSQDSPRAHDQVGVVVPHIVENENENGNGKGHNSSLSAMTLESLPPDNAHDDEDKKLNGGKEMSVLEENGERLEYF